MRDIKCRYCEERVTIISGPVSDIELNEFVGAGLWMYLHLKRHHAEILERFDRKVLEGLELFIVEIKKLYGDVFIDET